MKIILTGGHLTPALAIIEELSSKGQSASGRKGHKILFVGRKYALEGDPALSLEYKIINSLKIPFASITTGRLQRIFTRYTIPSLFKIPFGFIQAFRIVNDFKPDVVLSFGGYLSLPVIFSAFFLRIPIVIHEQTLDGGIANRIASKFAQKICISWETSQRFFPKEKTVLTGNPLRREFRVPHFAKASRGRQSSEPTIYVTGGSLGSHVINILVEGSIEKLLQKFNMIHQTGEAKEYNDFKRLQALKNNLSGDLKKRYVLKKFLNTWEVSQAIMNSDLVVSRAGINTICELMFLEKPSLLIPISFSSEQTRNALFLKKLGLAKVLSEKNLTSVKFETAIESMIKNIETYKKNIHAAKSLIKEDAAKKIARVVTYVAAKTSDK